MCLKLFVMSKRQLLICFFMSFFIQASVQNALEGFVGDSAFFSCHLDRDRLRSLTAHWRLNDNLNVYDIINGKGMTEEQSPQFHARIKTFPSEYVKGNFSLTLKSLTSSDEGAYCCFIADSSGQQCTTLQVKERPRGFKGNTAENSGADSKTERIASLLLLSSLLFWSTLE